MRNLQLKEISISLETIYQSKLTSKQRILSMLEQVESWKSAKLKQEWKRAEAGKRSLKRYFKKMFFQSFDFYFHAWKYLLSPSAGEQKPGEVTSRICERKRALSVGFRTSLGFWRWKSFQSALLPKDFPRMHSLLQNNLTENYRIPVGR